MKKAYIFIFTMTVLFIGGCLKQNSPPEQEKKAQQTEKENWVEGDIYSKDRWIKIQANIDRIHIGMNKKDIIETLGQPDGRSWTPENILQYTVACSVLGEDKLSECIHIVVQFDKVVEIKKDAFVYGPPPQ